MLLLANTKTVLELYKNVRKKLLLKVTSPTLRGTHSIFKQKIAYIYYTLCATFGFWHSLHTTVYIYIVV